jgi:hypothetical protein
MKSMKTLADVSRPVPFTTSNVAMTASPVDRWSLSVGGKRILEGDSRTGLAGTIMQRARRSESAPTGDGTTTSRVRDESGHLAALERRRLTWFLVLSDMPVVRLSAEGGLHSPMAQATLSRWKLWPSCTVHSSDASCDARFKCL